MLTVAAQQLSERRRLSGAAFKAKGAQRATQGVRPGEVGAAGVLRDGACGDLLIEERHSKRQPRNPLDQRRLRCTRSATEMAGQIVADFLKEAEFARAAVELCQHMRPTLRPYLAGFSIHGLGRLPVRSMLPYCCPKVSGKSIVPAIVQHSCAR